MTSFPVKMKKTIEGYAISNSEVASCSSFRDIQKQSLLDGGGDGIRVSLNDDNHTKFPVGSNPTANSHKVFFSSSTYLACH